MAFQSDIGDDLAAMQQAADRTTDDTLESTQRMKVLGYEAQDAGTKTLQLLDDQGNQLDQIEDGIQQIDADMREAEKNLQEIQKCCGLCICPWNRKKNFEETDKYKSVWKENGDEVVSHPTRKNKPKTTQPETAQSGYIQRITNDAREDEIDGNLAEVSMIVGDLKGMAENMGMEIERQNDQLDRINEKADMASARINAGNKEASKILRN